MAMFAPLDRPDLRPLASVLPLRGASYSFHAELAGMGTTAAPLDPTWPYPLTQEQIKALNDDLYEALDRDGCDRTVRHTRAFLEARRLPVRRMLAWLRREGGYCDCEVYLNVTSSLANSAGRRSSNFG